MQTILESAVRAANASGRQSYSIVTTYDKQKMKLLSGYTGDCLMLFCVDFTRIMDLAKHMGYAFPVSDIVGFVAGSTDAAFAAQTACIAAKSLGIDSIFTNNIHRGDLQHVYDLLQLPKEHCFPLVALVLGYATQERTYQQGRLAGPGIIHLEQYHRLTAEECDAMVAEYDDPAGHLAISDDWVKEGAKHYLDWFFQKWVRRPDTRQLFAALDKAGFIPHTR